MMRRGSYTAGERFVPSKPDFSCRVLLMDGSDVVVDLNKKALGQVVFDQVLRKLEILERDYFGLQLRDGHNRPIWVDFMKPIKKQIKKSSKVHFRVKYYPADPISCHGKARNQFYLQLKVDIAEGWLLCPPNTAPSFYSLILQADIGDFESNERDLEHLQENHMLPSKSLLDEINKFHKYHRGMNPQEAVNRFLKKAREMETYGMRFTDVKSEGDEVLYQLGLCPSGIALNRNTRLLNLYKWSRIAQVSYKGKQLTLRIKGHGMDEGRYIPVNLYLDTVQLCEELWQECVEHLDFFSNPQHSLKSPPDSEDAASSPEVTPSHTSSIIHPVMTSHRSSDFLHEHVTSHPILEQPELLSEEEERRRKRVRKVQSFPKKLPSEDPIMAAVMSKRIHRSEGRSGGRSSSPLSPDDDPHDPEDPPPVGGPPRAGGQLAWMSEEVKELVDGDHWDDERETRNGSNHSNRSKELFDGDAEIRKDAVLRGVAPEPVKPAAHEKFEEEEEEENRKTPGVSFERFRHDRKSYMKAVHRAPLLVPYERVKHVVMDNYHRDTADENKDVAYNWVQVHQNSNLTDVPNTQDNYLDSGRLATTLQGPPILLPNHSLVQTDTAQVGGEIADTLFNHVKSDSMSTPDSLSVLPAFSRVSSTNSDRVSNTSRGQRPPSGSEPSPSANTPEGQRPPSANTSGGQRPRSANTPGGQRPPSANTFGGQRPPSANTPGGQRPPSANTSGGQRPPSANTSGGQRPPSANAPGGQRPPSANTPGGQRPPSAGKAGTDVSSVIPNSAPYDANKRTSQGLLIGGQLEGGGADHLYEHLPASPPPRPLAPPPSGAPNGLDNGKQQTTMGPPVFLPNHFPVQTDVSAQGKFADVIPNHAKSDSLSTPPDSISLLPASRVSSRVSSATSDRASTRGQRPSSADNSRGQRSPSAANSRGQRPPSAILTGTPYDANKRTSQGLLIGGQLEGGGADHLYERLPASPPPHPLAPPPSGVANATSSSKPDVAAEGNEAKHLLREIDEMLWNRRVGGDDKWRMGGEGKVLPEQFAAHDSVEDPVYDRLVPLMSSDANGRPPVSPPPSLPQTLRPLPTVPTSSQASLTSQAHPQPPPQSVSPSRSLPHFLTLPPPPPSAPPTSRAPLIPSQSSQALATPPSSQTLIPSPSSQTLVPPPSSHTLVPPPSSHTLVPPPSSQTLVPPPSSQTLVPPPSSQTLVPPPSSQTLVPPPSSQTLVPPPFSQSLVPPPFLQALPAFHSPPSPTQSSSSHTLVPSPPSLSLVSALSMQTLPKSSQGLSQTQLSSSSSQAPLAPLATALQISPTQSYSGTDSNNATGEKPKHMRGPTISWNTLVQEAMTADDLPPPPPHLLALANQDSRLLPSEQNRPMSTQPTANPSLLPSTGQLNPAFSVNKPTFSVTDDMSQYPPEIASFMTRVKGPRERGNAGAKNSELSSPDLNAALQPSASPSALRRYRSARGPYTHAETLNNQRDVRASLPRNNNYTQGKVSIAREMRVVNGRESKTQGRLQDIFESFDNLFTSKLSLQHDHSPEKPIFPDDEKNVGQGREIITSTENHNSRSTMSNPTFVPEPEQTKSSFQEHLKALPNTKKSGKARVLDWIERSSDVWSYDTQFPMLKDKDTVNPLQQYQRPSHLYEDPVQVVQGGIQDEDKTFFVDV